jgi:hypothetical protein
MHLSDEDEEDDDGGDAAHQAGDSLLSIVNTRGRRKDEKRKNLDSILDANGALLVRLSIIINKHRSENVDPCASYGGRQFVHSLFAKLMATYRAMVMQLNHLSLLFDLYADCNDKCLIVSW